MRCTITHFSGTLVHNTTKNVTLFWCNIVYQRLLTSRNMRQRKRKYKEVESGPPCLKSLSNFTFNLMSCGGNKQNQTLSLGFPIPNTCTWTVQYDGTWTVQYVDYIKSRPKVSHERRHIFLKANDVMNERIYTHQSENIDASLTRLCAYIW